MASYLGSLLLIFMGFFVASLLLFQRGLGKLLDPIGIRFVVEDFAHLWTTIEKNWRLVGLEGTVLQNRLVWLGVALAVLAITYLRFRFAHRTESTRGGARTRRARCARRRACASASRASAPVVRPARPARLRLRHARAPDARDRVDSFRDDREELGRARLLRGHPAAGGARACSTRWCASGIPLMPETAQVLEELTGPLSAELSRWVIVPLLFIFFAGELVWRERDARLDEITDATPVSDWVPFARQVPGLGLVLVAFMALLMAAGMLARRSWAITTSRSGCT